jgi:general secretion pathway protein D
MKRPVCAALSAAIVCAATSGRAQSVEPSPPKLAPFDPAIKFDPKDPGANVTFQLEDADLNELCHAIAELTGKRFLIETTKSKGFKATVFSPQKVTVSEAYQAFLSVLQANRLTVVPFGRFLKIVDAQDITRQTVPLAAPGEPATAEERYVTRILRLSHVSADDVASNVLSKFQSADGSVVPYAPGNLLILTDTGPNLQRMTRILEDLDVGSPDDKVYFQPLHYVASSDLARQIGDVFELETSMGGKTSSGEAHKQAGGAAVDPRAPRIIPIDRPNALAIVGTPDAYQRILTFLDKVDIPAADGGHIHVVKLQYGDSKKIVDILNSVVGGAASSSGTSGPSRPAAGAPGSAPLAVLEAPVKLSADDTTNSVVITSGARDFAALSEVIANLDQPRRQVYIDVAIMDLSVDRANELSIALHGLGTADSALGAGSVVYSGFQPIKSAGSLGTVTQLDPNATKGFVFGARGPEIDATNALGMTIPAVGLFLNALATDTDSDITQVPSVTATDNQEAELKAQLHKSLQTNMPSYSAPTSTTGSPVAGYPLVTSPASTNYQPIGVAIKVKPHLNESDEVRLDVTESISDVAGPPEGTLGQIPFFERSVTTTLTVKDGKTAVIGGLVSNKVTKSQTKVPILGDIPLLGALFRSSSDEVTKNSLVLVLTPYIVRGPEDMDRIYERKNQEQVEFRDHNALFSDEAAYQAPKDYSRLHGMVADLAQAYQDVAAKRALGEMGKRKDVQGHEPQAPLPMPVPGALRGTGGSPAPAPPPPSPPPTVNVTAQARSLDRIEK